MVNSKNAEPKVPSTLSEQQELPPNYSMFRNCEVNGRRTLCVESERVPKKVVLPHSHEILLVLAPSGGADLIAKSVIKAGLAGVNLSAVVFIAAFLPERVEDNKEMDAIAGEISVHEPDFVSACLERQLDLNKHSDDNQSQADN